MTFRLFPATNGPASPVPFNVDGGHPDGQGNFISGVAFTVTQSGCWFEGYWWWVCPSGQYATPRQFALWSATSASAGSVVPGSEVTSGTLIAGQWNYVPLASPVQLAVSAANTSQGSTYIAAVGTNGSFPDTSGFWSSAVTNGPLTAWSGIGQGLAPPYSLAQGLFSTAGSDPGATMPNQQSSIDNFWLDVQVSLSNPSGSYAGSYRLWPNKADSNPVTGTDSAVAYTIATEIHLSQACTLDNAWYYSPSGVTELATRADVYSIATGLAVASVASPSWLTASGGAGSAGAGWLKAAFAGGTVLPAGKYRVAVYCSAGGSGAFGAKDATSDYWGQTLTSGAGANGITWGPLYAPPQPLASSGFTFAPGSPGTTPPYAGAAIPAQSVFGQTPSGIEIFPQLYAPVGGSLNQSQNYWIDLEVTPAGTAHTASASLTVTPQLSASRSQGHVRSASLTVAPVFAAIGKLVTPPGSWWGLVSVLRHSEQEFESFISRPPVACPRCGEPLINAPATPSGSGVQLFCRYDGWRYPRDHHPPTRMGRGVV